MFEPIVIWDLEDDPEGNVAHHIAEHGITQDEVEDAVGDPRTAASRAILPADRSPSDGPRPVDTLELCGNTSATIRAPSSP